MVETSIVNMLNCVCVTGHYQRKGKKIKNAELLCNKKPKIDTMCQVNIVIFICS